jgi:aspartate racemase
MTMKTTGIIGGMSWTSSLEYYRLMNQLVNERLGGSHSAELVLWSVDFGAHLEIHDREGWDGVAGEAGEIAQRLQDAGADFLIMAVNTLHKVYDEVAAAVDVPILHIADAVGGAIQDAGLDRVGLLGTRHTMHENFYRRRLRERFGIEVITPDVDDAVRIDRLIFDELVIDRYTDAARDTCLAVVDRLAEADAQGVILGCTELPKLVTGASMPVPAFDTLAIHVRAAVDFALESKTESG